MRRTLNYKLLGVLLIVGILGLGGMHLLHGYQVRRTAGVLLARAEKVGGEGKLQDQLDLLRRYLAYRPDNVDALEKYGLILARATSKEPRAQALETLDRVLTRDPSRRSTRKVAGDLAFGLDQFDAARTHYEALERSTPGGEAALEEALGRCEEESKRPAEAVSWLEKAIGHDPGRVEASARLARILRKQLNRPDRADLVMDAREDKSGLIAKNPGSAKAYLARALYRREFAIPGAEDDLVRALGLAPDDPEVLLAAAESARADAAARLLEHGIEVQPTNPRFYEGLATLEARQGRRGRAIERLGEGIRRLPEDRNLRWILAELEIDEGRRDEAAAEIEKLRLMGSGPTLLEFLQERLLFGEHRWTEAARRLAVTAPTLESIAGAIGLAKRAFLLLARCHAQLGNPDMRYAAARRAVALEVDDPTLAVAAREELALALAGLGRLDEAAETYRVALRMPEAPDRLLVELGKVLVVKNLRLPAGQRRWDEAEAILDRAEVASPSSADAAVLRAEVLAVREQLDAAGDRLRQAEEAHPDLAGPKVARAALAERRGRSGEALAILEEARKRLGDRAELLSALSQYWSARPGEAGSRALIGLADAAAGIGDQPARSALLGLIAEGLDRVGDAGKAASIRDRLAVEQPDHLGVRLAQFDAALKADDLVAAGRVLDEVRRIEGPEGSLWRYGRARLLILSARRAKDPKGLDEARTLLAEARQRRPGWARVILIGAELDDLRGDSGSALRGYLDAIEGGERDPSALRRAVQLLYRRGRFAQADALLGRVRQEGALSPELNRLAADVALQTHDEGRAIDLARRAVAGQPDSASDQAWFGQLLLSASRAAAERGRADEAKARKEEAEKALNRAVELAPSDPVAQASLILALASWGRIDDARQAIRKAEGTLKGPVAELALARCMEAVGRPAEAEARYQAILKERPDDVPALQAAAVSSLRSGKVGEAEPLLRRLIALQSKTPREAAWARRVLALALSFEGREGGAKARALLGLDDESTANPAEAEANLSADDARARAQVLARQPGRSSRRKALAIVDGLAARDDARPSDLFLRCQLLAAEGDWKRARASAKQLLAEDPTNPTLLEFLARGQIASGDPSEVPAWLDELERLRPGSAGVVELRALALFAAKQPDQAVTMLRALSLKEPALGPKVANILEDAGRLGEAEALLRSSAADGPTPEAKVDASLALAAFLGRRGRHGDAVAVCERLWADPAVVPSRVSSVALTALYTGQPDRAVLDRVEAGVSAALARKPGDIVLRFDSANLAILRGRYAEAEATFRDLHKTDPGLGAPLNNLAWLLALRGTSGPEPLELVDRAIALDGPLPDLLDTRGLVLALRGQPERAVEDLEESIAAAPSPTAYLHLALALRKAGRPSEAAEALGKARASGLRPGDVHPLERPGYLELVAAYPERR